MYTFRYYSNAGNAVVLRGRLCERDRVEEEEESLFKADAEEEGLFKADATRSRRQDKDHGTIESGPRLPVRHRLLTPYGHSGGENWARCTACNEGHDGARSTRQMARVAPAAQLR